MIHRNCIHSLRPPAQTNEPTNCNEQTAACMDETIRQVTKSFRIYFHFSLQSMYWIYKIWMSACTWTNSWVPFSNLVSVREVVFYPSAYSHMEWEDCLHHNTLQQLHSYRLWHRNPSSAQVQNCWPRTHEVVDIPHACLIDPCQWTFTRKTRESIFSLWIIRRT